MVNIERALRFPVAEQGSFVKIIVGAILSVIPIINFISLGYIYQLMSNIINERQEMPEWGNFGEKFVRGFMVLIIGFIYMLIPLIVGAITGGGAAFRGGLGLLLGGFFISFIIAIVIGFLLPMALAHYVSTESFASAFDLKTIFSYISSNINNYLIAYVVIIVLCIILGIVSAIPVIGWIISILGGFYIACTACFLFGEIYRNAAVSKSDSVS